jgi:hypothetical protein
MRPNSCLYVGNASSRWDYKSATLFNLTVNPASDVMLREVRGVKARDAKAAMLIRSASENFKEPVFFRHETATEREEIPVYIDEHLPLHRGEQRPQKKAQLAQVLDDH